MQDDDKAKRIILDGVTGGVLNAALLFTAGAAIATTLAGWWTPYDDTDPANGRSGLVVYTDCLTGRQYLGTGRGGLTPRVGRDGQQISVDCAP